jgi:fibronectin type 3 domain-containing protein
VASAEVPVEMKDVFPPEAPMGLVAVPGFAGEAEVQVGEQAQRAAIDLSWEPDMELHVAGYRVYRHDLDVDATNAWQQLNSLPAPVAAYRDLSVVAGRRYAYRVTAVDAAGNESTRSDEAVETAPAP